MEELLDAVSKLSPTEQARFERDLKTMRQRRLSLKEKVSRCAESYKFSPKQQNRLRELLEKNKEELISPEEEKELDALLEELDRCNLLLADEIFTLAHLPKRKDKKIFPFRACSEYQRGDECVISLLPPHFVRRFGSHARNSSQRRLK